MTRSMVNAAAMAIVHWIEVFAHFSHFCIMYIVDNEGVVNYFVYYVFLVNGLFHFFGY